ncbi:MAG: hypothetical protein H6658_05130 [Ardenticatenaceae bacterium]|nr:hypothetical protein [Ardenticatenaceae bacterium]
MARFQQQQINRDKFVLSVIILERFVTRFFSEKMGILPGWTSFLDIPLLAVFFVYVAFITRQQTNDTGKTGFGALGLFLLIDIALSALVNLDRLHPGAFTLFIIGFLEPLIYMGLAYLLSPKEEVSQFLIKLLIFIGWLQILVVAVLDVPRFLVTRNPDFITGTFGENPYQLVFFLMTWNVLILSGPAQRGRASFFRGVGIVIVQIMVLVIILLAQFRSIIFFAVFTWALTYVVISRDTRRALVNATVGVILFIALFAAVNRWLPELKYQDLLELNSRASEVIESGKVQSILNFQRLVYDQPQVLLIGTGPGTYVSRGFETFSIVGGRETANQLYRQWFGTELYRTDVADRYVIPILGRFAFGAGTTATPWFSYLALLAELGLPGTFIVLVIYGKAIWFCWQNNKVEGSIAILARWVFIGLVLLLQMASLGNWLEVSRLTVPLWTVFGIMLAQVYAARDGQPTP